MRVLFIRLSALGDVIHTLPAAFAIKKCMPDTKISWIVEPPQLELLKNNPVVDEVIEMPKSVWQKAICDPTKWIDTSKEIASFFSDLKKRKFDVAVDFQGLLKSAVIGYAAGAPVRVGYKGLKERSDLFYTHKLDVGNFNDFDTHVVEHHLALSEFMLRIAGRSDVEFSANAEFPLPAPSSENRKRIDSLLSQLENKKTVVLIPGTTWESKIWPYEKWVSLAEKINHASDCQFVLAGGPGDIKTNSNIASMFLKNCPDATMVDASGKTTILELIHLYERSDLVIGLDSGPIHLAAAVNSCPSVAIHGATPWIRNGPYGESLATGGSTVHLELECQPCFKRVCPLGTTECLRDLSEQKVFEHVERFLGE